VDHEKDLLEAVVAALEERKGDLPAVAAGTGIPYDTVLRIKNRENDPGYSKVRRLADFLFGATQAGPTEPTAV
jgi:hypothetical protein